MRPKLDQERRKLRAASAAVIFLTMALALPALGLDPRCDTKPDHPGCQMEDPPTPPSPPPDPGDPAPTDAISVIGCSNTHHAVAGYLDASATDVLINTAYAGHTIEYWATSPKGWDDHYLPLRPSDGYDAVWLNLCERANSGLTLENVEAVLAKLWAIDPGVPVWISPLNYYEEELCSVTNGNEISNSGAVLADALSSDNDLVLRGPDLGPLNDALLRLDNCHPNGKGIAFLGTQLLEFFDG